MYSVRDGWLSQRGLPHSDTSGSQPVSGFPELFAAVRVLLRLSLPRHPPCALRSLTVYPKGTCLLWRCPRRSHLHYPSPSLELGARCTSALPCFGDIVLDATSTRTRSRGEPHRCGITTLTSLLRYLNCQRTGRRRFRESDGVSGAPS